MALDSTWRHVEEKDIELLRTNPNEFWNNVSGVFFENIESLTELTIPNTVKYFHIIGCKNLKTLTFAEGITKIDDVSVDDLENLEKIIIPSSVEKIGYTFTQLPNLHEIVYKGQSYTFENIDGFSYNNIILGLIAQDLEHIDEYIYATNNNIHPRILQKLTSIGHKKLSQDAHEIIRNPLILQLVDEGCDAGKVIEAYKDGALDFYAKKHYFVKKLNRQIDYGDITAEFLERVDGADLKKFRALYDMFIAESEQSSHNLKDFMVLAYNMGIFEDKQSTMQVKNDQGKILNISVSEYGFNILQKLIKEITYEKLHMYFSGMRYTGVNEEFLRFLSNKQNFTDIIQQEKETYRFFTRTLAWFDSRKALEGLGDVEDNSNTSDEPTSEQNRYKIKTYETTESGIDKLRWKTPTVALLVKEFTERKFKNVNPSNKHIAEFLSKYGQYEQKHFDKAVEIDEERKFKKAPIHILGEPLKENLVDAYREYISKTDKLREEILTTADETLVQQEQTADMVFSYEMLAKNDVANFAIGFMTSCCATLYGAGAGAMRAMITSKNMQALVIRNHKEEIVAFGIIYVNKAKGYAVVNDFEVNETYGLEMEALGAIYEKAIKGVEAFVEKYNSKNADKPIRIVTCGTSPNWEALNSYIRANPESEILKAPNFDDFKYAGSGTWSGDWHSHQYILWQEHQKLNERSL